MVPTRPALGHYGILRQPVDIPATTFYNPTKLTNYLFINGGIISEQNRLTSLIPKWYILSQD